MSDAEVRGFAIFAHESKEPGTGRCSLYHTVTADENGYALFTDFSYDNLGIPINPETKKNRVKLESFIAA